MISSFSTIEESRNKSCLLIIFELSPTTFTMRFFILFIFTLIISGLYSQYSTPGTGIVWNMDSLVANSTGSVTFQDVDIYQINTELHISANDSIHIEGQIISVAPGVTIYVEGSINIDGDESILMGIIGGNFPFGIRLEEAAIGFFKNVTFQYFGGIKVLTPDFHLENCQLFNHSPALTTGGAVEISHGNPIFLNNVFANNDVSAISSAANSQVAPHIEGNLIQNNVFSNTNRPQINLGPSGGSDTTKIIDNTIIGDDNNEMAGGIAFSSLVGGAGNIIIQGNSVQTNRYGIAIIGNGLRALIDNNVIHANNTQNEPFLGGSGINLNGNSTSFAILSNNDIRNNLWGVTIQGSFMASLGNGIDDTIDSPGHNVFAENSNNGQLYALFNNTPNLVVAMFNCWNDTLESLTLEIAESVISHQVDDPELGEVIFDPLGECFSVGVNEISDISNLIELHPNPSNTYLNVVWPIEIQFQKLLLTSATGQVISEIQNLENKRILIDVHDLSSGVYYLIFQSKDGILTKKFVRS
ncbi:MAG: hypothetical protein ACI9EV_001336 [Urechidicola sp.]|jgi:hypothetical protein